MFTIMKRMTVVLVLLIGVLTLLSGTVQAQLQRKSIEDQVKILKNKLQLNDEQTKKITIILEDQREEMTTAMSEKRGDRTAMRMAMQEIIKKSDDKIKELLIEEQLSVYEEMIQDRQAQMSRRMKGSRK